MKAELISIGDELLLGQTINTNATWIGEQLAHHGIRLYQISTITDEKAHIINALDEAADRADLILLTGGLGPTKDDITKHTLCEYFGTELEMNAEVLAFVEDAFAKLGREMLEVNRQQAALPKAARVVRNHRGTASGMWFERNGKVFISMPGVPYEMKAMMREEILPALQERFRTTTLHQRTILTQGMGESHLAERIADWENDLRKNGLSLAYLPSPGIVKLRVSAPNNDALTTYVDELYQLIPGLIYGEGQETLEKALGDLLLKVNGTLALAESCTGGQVAQAITAVPGASVYFKGGIVAYANEVKSIHLGVKAATLEAHGAVSEQVAMEMAEGAAKALDSKYAISTTGIAGPDGGSEEKPVGTVWVGIKTPESLSARRFQLFGQRKEVVQRATRTALNQLRRTILHERGW